MEKKLKKCKGTGKAKGSGCDKSKFIEKYGLCYNCYRLWLFNTPVGNEECKKIIIISKKKVQAGIKKDNMEEKRSIDTKGAMKLADTYFSRYVRLKHSDGINCTCYTCGAIKAIKETDNGHFIVRVHKATRYNENNCRPQCKTCNGDTLHRGKQKEFRLHLVNEIGLHQVEDIENLSTTQIKANTVFYRELADKYRILVNELQKEMKIKVF